MKRLRNTAGAFCMPAVIAILFSYVVTAFFMGGSSLHEQAAAQKTYTVQIGTLTEELTEEAYMLGCMAAALSPDADAEAMKAMAVVLRTQLYAQQEETPVYIDASAFLEPYMRAQAWGVTRYAAFEEAASAAVEATAGEVLRNQDGALIEALYHGISAGRTRSGGSDYPYLQQKESAWDLEAAQYLTVYWFETAQLLEVFPDITEEDWEQAVVTEETDSYYIKEVLLGEQTVEGEVFRQALSLCSSSYFVSWKGNGLQVVCRGQGHGFGLSCYGAQQLAEAGSSYTEILTWYYTDVTVTQ